MTAFWIVVAFTAAIGLAFAGRGRAAWVAPGAGLMFVWLLSGPASWPFFLTVALLFAAGIALLGSPPRRAAFVTRRLAPFVARMLPKLGATEREALEAGTVWWDRELFSGRPDWNELLGFHPKPLSAPEQAFLDGPVEQLCRMLDDWAVVQRGDLPEEVWTFLKRQRFFGMIIPEEFGGLGFSAQAHSRVVEKIASRSVTAAVTVMVPNSLGPGELLVHYGTAEQKAYYLPRLARGEEIPCFALTGPEAGSDAAATQSIGVVCRGSFEGQELLGIRLSWRKRYITLSSVSTLIGVAFRLSDPDRLLGGDEELGITCALVPAQLPGIEIGRRHDPMGVPFHNGPTEGHDVFVPLDAVIGGRAGAGRGWTMLMQSLAVGRSISLPSLSTGGAKLAARLVSAYAMVREQFDTPIGRFEGVQEPLARIAGLTYLMDATRALTCAAIDAGEKPAVLSAIAKAWLTEAMRDVVADAMDIRAGAAIQRGPRNVLARAWASVPIGITVEGANILTRSMIIYGQGAIRCHPFALEEIVAVENGDIPRLDRALFGHVGHVVRTAIRAPLLALTRGRLETGVPDGPLRRELQRLSRLSAAFALVSEGAMVTLGGALKRRESITGRLADALAWMYLASAAAHRFEHDGQPEGDASFARWGIEHALAQAEGALDGVLRNLPARPVAGVLRALVLPIGRSEPGPDDARGSEVARALLDDPAARDRLTAGIFHPPADELGLGRLEAALAKATTALSVEARLRAAVRDARLEHAPGDDLARAGLAAGVISEVDLKALEAADAARDEVIRVDDFDEVQYAGLRG
ncbi:MAG: acyl-CoA dehydrogenase [Deltaproteobacteria bacterium]|nr:acyl-CoA dehydrogenase [Deltaproteobacteria bacterium]